MGILIAGLVTLIKEYKSDLIFSKQRIISLLNLKLLAILETAADEKNWSKEIILPLNEQEIEKLKKVNINLISLGNIKNNNKKKIFTIFNDNFKKFTECDVDNLDKNGLNILIIEKGKIKKNEITRFLDKIKIYNLDIEYWILID